MWVSSLALCNPAVSHLFCGGRKTKLSKFPVSTQRHPGNPFAALHVSKNLSELERLRLMVAKLEIENERLKKGYWVEGVGANKAFVTGPDKSTKSLKR